jgi:hypothetical protein
VTGDWENLLTRQGVHSCLGCNEHVKHAKLLHKPIFTRIVQAGKAPSCESAREQGVLENGVRCGISLKGFSCRVSYGPLKPTISQSHLTKAQENVKIIVEVGTKNPFAYGMIVLIELNKRRWRIDFG